MLRFSPYADIGSYLFIHGNVATLAFNYIDSVSLGELLTKLSRGAGRMRDDTGQIRPKNRGSKGEIGKIGRQVPTLTSPIPMLL